MQWVCIPTLTSPPGATGSHSELVPSRPDAGLPATPSLLATSQPEHKAREAISLDHLVIFSKIGFFLTVVHEEQKGTRVAAKLLSLRAGALEGGLAWKGKCLWGRLQFSIHLERRRAPRRFLK